MRKLFVSLSLVLAVFVAGAQSRTESGAAGSAPKTIEQKVDEAMVKITEKLSLTSQQQSRIKPLMSDFFKTKDQMSALKESNNEEYRAKMTTAAEALIAKLKTILDAKQVTAFNNLLEQYRAERN
ncbi:MAG: hypothetical protein KIS94_08790 [Chitinophagales bacterium]|nr:hypothetical protein [Chitinophagales bacterium]